jgi:ParB-like chromosome segregation protein Spo0J
MNVHPACAAVPNMTDQQFNELLDSMNRVGYDKRFPIVVYQDQILDGRHRYKAAKKLGIDPPTVEWQPIKGTDDHPAKFVLRANQRRDLTPGQRAALATDLEPFYAEEAAKRERAGTLAPAGARVGKAAQNAANDVGATPRSVERAKEIKATDPAEFEAVKQGKPLKTALRDARKKQAAKSSPSIADDGPPDAVVVRDGLDLAVSDPKLAEFFSAGDQFKEWQRRVHAIKREIVAFAGEHVAGRKINPAEVERAANDLVRCVHNALPYTSCPVGKSCGKGCGQCGGAGFITAYQWKAVVPEVQKAHVRRNGGKP